MPAGSGENARVSALLPRSRGRTSAYEGLLSLPVILLRVPPSVTGLTDCPPRRTPRQPGGITTAVRSGTSSASTAIWARCSMARTPSLIPPLQPAVTRGLLRKAKERKRCRWRSSAPRDQVLVLRGDDQTSVALFDLALPLPHDRRGLGRVVEVPDRSQMLGEEWLGWGGGGATRDGCCSRDVAHRLRSTDTSGAAGGGRSRSRVVR